MKNFFLSALLLAAVPALAQTMPGMPMPKTRPAAAPATPALPPAAPGVAAPPPMVPEGETAQGTIVSPRASYVGKRVEYDLYVDEKPVNFTGKARMGLAINGQIPAPTLRFNEGDTAVIRVHNRLASETSTHWHGILLPNEQDGVSYLTTAPILPGSTHTFTFPLTHSGTYWYHAHSLQEQSGLYGAIVIQPRVIPAARKEYLVELSEWTDEAPAEVLRYLKRGGEWYAVQKGATQSYGEALATGYFADKVKQEWGRMPAMDVADVAYNKFLMNGRGQNYFTDAQPGEVVRLRIVNSGASSYFYVQYAGGPLRVVAADGVDVQPFSTAKLKLATGETYDVLITVPDMGAAELRATSTDVSGYTSAYFGSGAPLAAPAVPKLNYFQMMREMNSMGAATGMILNGSGTMKKGKRGSMEMLNDPSATGQGSISSVPGKEPKNDKAMKGMDMAAGAMPAAAAPPRGRPLDAQDNGGMSMGRLETQGGGMAGMGGMGGEFSYNQLRALQPTTLDSTKKWREIKLVLTGNMLRYIWSFDNKTLSVADVIAIRKGENVRIVLQNLTMMQHPLHLHGHFFRLVNAQGAYSPLKHTFDIPSMNTVTIEFDANEERDWFFHCHILYHMAAGMGRVVSYEGSPQNEYAKTGYKAVKRGDNAWYPWFDFSAHSQAAWLQGAISNNKNALEVEARGTYKGDVETETHLLRYLDKRQFLSVFVGFDYRRNRNLIRSGDLGKTNTTNSRQEPEFGVYYLLPMLVRSEFRTDPHGNLRLQLERRDLPLSSNVFADLRVNTDKEFNVNFRYLMRKNLSLSTNYDSDYKWGAGLTFHY